MLVTSLSISKRQCSVKEPSSNVLMGERSSEQTARRQEQLDNVRVGEVARSLAGRGSRRHWRLVTAAGRHRQPARQAGTGRLPTMIAGILHGSKLHQ